MTSKQDIDDCWRNAYKLIEVGKGKEAIFVCKTEPCASNSTECQNYLGWTCYEKKDLTKALGWFKKAANKGSPEALFGMASVDFVNKNFSSALCLFKDAADQRYFRACYWVGYMYEHGLGVERNTSLALSYYKNGAKNGYLIAERATIQMVFKTGALLDKMFVVPKLIALIIRSMPIAYKDIDDERIADVPNVLVDDK